MKISARRILLYIVLSILVVVWIVPVYSTLLVSFRTVEDYGKQIFWDIPTKFNFGPNVLFAWRTAKLGQHFIASLMYAPIGALGAIFFASLAGFSLARLRPKGSFILFLIIWSGTIFPFQMYLVPLFRMFLTTNLYDTRVGLLLVYIAICIPFCIFIFRNYFSTIPYEIQEAARLDGCSDFGIYWKIFLPLSKPAVAVLLLFQFTWIWNDLVFGLVLARSQEIRPIMVGLSMLQGVYGRSNIPGMMAGAMMASIPTVLLFASLQKYFIRGLVLRTAG